ncbi:MAG: IS3 family transposase [Acidimicrobiales bacterium]|nr:IS3 family transposase [Acidimicrobiales bacterium]MYK71418.1 IS3 family transposase [Acidimicrobiales bacterium]
MNSLFKTELVRRAGQGPWRTVDDVQLATLDWIRWWNTTRIRSYLATSHLTSSRSPTLPDRPTATRQEFTTISLRKTQREPVVDCHSFGTGW